MAVDQTHVILSPQGKTQKGGMEQITRPKHMRYRLREAATPQDLDRILALRGLVFRGGLPDADAFDSRCHHLMVEEAQTGALVACYRLLHMTNGAAIGGSYAAQFYTLDRLRAYPWAMIELGRFCLHPDHTDPDILRLAWGGIAQAVDTHGAGLLFGCSSFRGTDPAPYSTVYAYLRARHLAPDIWRPAPKGGDGVSFEGLSDQAPTTPPKGLPPLLRSYLQMGGWVSDHAVIDRDLGTQHIFTGLEIAAIPPNRARRLRGIAAQLAATQGLRPISSADP